MPKSPQGRRDISSYPIPRGYYNSRECPSILPNWTRNARMVSFLSLLTSRKCLEMAWVRRSKREVNSHMTCLCRSIGSWPPCCTGGTIQNISPYLSSSAAIPGTGQKMKLKEKNPETSSSKAARQPQLNSPPRPHPHRTERGVGTGHNLYLPAAAGG